MTAEKGEHPPHGAKHTIEIDGKEYPVSEQTMTGAQLKALAGIASEYQLFLEQPGEDRSVGDNDSIKLNNSMKFYSLPPATFG